MNQDTIKQRLIAARALIDTPEKWTKGAFQRNATGRAVAPHDEAVAAYCAFGAIRRVCWHPDDFEVYEPLGELHQQVRWVL